MEGQPGISRAKIRQYTGLAESTQRRLRALYDQTGAVTRTPERQGRKRILNAMDISFIEGCIERMPDISLQELQEALREARDIYVSLSTIHRSLKRRGFSRVKLSCPARERDDEARARYCMHIAENYQPEQLVYSILPALSLDGIIALDVFETSLTAEKFTLFIEMVLDCMNPFPQRNSVLVMDNASIHHAEGLRELVEARGMRLEYLPTYSPDLNPIEEAFSSIKAWIRSNRDYALSEMLGDEAADPYILIYDAVFTVTAEKARGWFMHSGYL
ncbi:hypothetical protein BN946_scf184664.g6 [Trametes cinnabarina]|uniref:Tc1-like transposase DDE domain-containing protein n=1 Tax=Pycnoporus cinnabarinus TaxID=5643 RepID=A0A060T0F1_PYCCI|nr:hypothetical protein BN946_scf184664.g6 [Trametes cinnabarina]